MKILLIVGLCCLVFGCMSKDKTTGVSGNDYLYGYLLYGFGFGMISSYLYLEYDLLFIAGMLTSLSIENFFKALKFYLSSR